MKVFINGKKSKDACMGSVPVGVEVISRPNINRVMASCSLATLPYLRPGLLITAEWAGSTTEMKFSI